MKRDKQKVEQPKMKLTMDPEYWDQFTPEQQEELKRLGIHRADK